MSGETCYTRSGIFLLEPLSGFPDGLLFDESLNSPSERGKICVVNMMRRGQIIKSCQRIGQAVQVDEVTPPSVAFGRFSPRSSSQIKVSDPPAPHKP